MHKYEKKKLYERLVDQSLIVLTVMIGKKRVEETGDERKRGIQKKSGKE
jgi:hypothetical protein